MKHHHLIAFVLAAGLAMPATASAATLPAKPAAGPEAGIMLIRDGEEARHWRNYPGAEFDVPTGLGDRFNLHVGARRGFALQPPRYPIEPEAPVVAPTGQDGSFGVPGRPASGFLPPTAQGKM